MFHEKNYNQIIQTMLEKIPDSFDKREGSLVFDALGPIAAEITQMYIALTHVLDITYAKKSYGEHLDKRVEEMGIFRKEAKPAHRLGVFLNQAGAPASIPLQSQFIIDDLIFKVEEVLDNENYLLICQEVGEKGNHPYGTMRGLTSHANLAKATLLDILIPGENIENDEMLYNRYMDYILEKPFAGNKAAYRQEMAKLPGVGPVKIIRPPAPTGTVSICFLASDYTAPSKHLIDEVKNHFDPEKNLAAITPLFQSVLPFGALITNIQTDIHCTFQKDIDEAAAKEQIIQILKEVEQSYVERWSKTTGDKIFLSHIESSIYQAGLLTDVTVYLRTKRNNVLLSSLQVPRFKEVIFHAL